MPAAAFGDDVVPLEEVEVAHEEVNSCIGEDAETDAKAITFLLAQEIYPERYARELATPAEVATACNSLSGSAKCQVRARTDELPEGEPFEKHTIYLYADLRCLIVNDERHWFPIYMRIGFHTETFE